MKSSATFEETPFDRNRVIIGDMYEESRRRPISMGLVEFDVTKARDLIQQHEHKTGEQLSFTGWITKCVAQAVSEHKQVQAYRKGKKIVAFNDVDVSIVVERDVEGKKIAMPYVIRNANTKTFRQIHNEIRAAQAQPIESQVLGEHPYAWLAGRFQSLPKFIRKLVWWKYRNDPFLARRISGTVGITAIGMYGNVSGWPINFGMNPLDIALGSITKKPGVVGDRIEIREYLHVTMIFNHDVVDGAPAARFTARLNELVTSAYGLEEFST